MQQQFIGRKAIQQELANLSFSNQALQEQLERLNTYNEQMYMTIMDAKEQILHLTNKNSELNCANFELNRMNNELIYDKIKRLIK